MRALTTITTFLISFNLWAGPFTKASPLDAPAGLEYNIELPIVENVREFEGKTVAILISHGVQESEITYPYEYLKSRGADIDIISPAWTNGKVLGVKYLKPTIWIKANLNFSQAMEKKYDLVVLTGGAWNSGVVRGDSNALKLIKKNNKEGVLISAICAGSQILIDANLSKGTNLTGTSSVKIDLINSGANFIDEPAVIDGNIITSRGPADVLEFMLAIHSKL
jgi:protease I